MVIQALNGSDAQECWAEMEECINSKMVVKMNINVTKYQALYLEVKQKVKISSMKKKCNELSLPSGKQLDELDEEVVLVKIVGTVNNVAAIEREMRDILDGYEEEKFELNTPFYTVWSKRWRQLVNNWEDFIIIFEQKGSNHCDSNVLNWSLMTTVSFVICGCDVEGIQRVKNMILTEESGSSVQTKTLQLPPNGAVALLKGLKEKQINTQKIAAEMDIDKTSNTVTIISPRMASDDMVKMEEAILSYVGDHSLKTETMAFTDPLVGLILKSPKYRYNDQLRNIIVPFNVRAIIPKYPGCEFSLIGNQQSVGTVKSYVQQLLKDISETIGQGTLQVEGRYVPMFASKDFHLLCTRVQEEFGVICSLPLYRRLNVTLRCVQLLPPLQLQLEIARGSLAAECADAIVTTSTGGALPTWVSEVGGPSIQAEFDNHVQKYGSMNPGDSVCLGGGDLPCRRVIHIMLSQWASEGHYLEELSFAIQNVMTLAQELGIDVVALPAIGDGGKGFSEHTCARGMLRVINDYFLEVGPAAKIHTVRCVLDTPTLVDAFLSSLQLICPMDVEEPVRQNSAPLPSSDIRVSVNGIEPVLIYQKIIKPFLSIFKRPHSQPERRPSLPSHLTATSSAAEEYVVRLRGPKDQLDGVAEKLISTLEGSSSIKSIAFPSDSNRVLERRLLEIAERLCVACSVETQPARDGNSIEKVLVLEGVTGSVERAIIAVKEEIDRYHTTAEVVPSHWQPQSKTTELFILPQGAPEWSQVFQKFQQTMPQARITSVQRIQNTWLWERYVQHRKRLHLKNSGVVNEKELFHGTRNNDPKLIYEGEDGFDMRYSTQGMWGVANYFAVNASYSHNYAHANAATGHREMFLVKVLTGDSYNCAPNSTLRMPPPKPSSGGLSQLRTKYDTVTGITHGSQVFMTYDNEKAYPAYLIQYN